MSVFAFRGVPRHQGNPRPAPLDLLAVAADDALLDALAAGAAVRGNDDPVPELFAAWQDELTVIRLPDPPSVDEARIAVRLAPRRPRSLGAVAAVAVGICALLMGSAVVGARSAGPGDALWPVTQVVWANQAESAVAGQSVRGALQQAVAALRDGRTNDAAAALAIASVGLQRVSSRDGHEAMQDDLDGLMSQLGAADPAAAQSGGAGAAGDAGGLQAGGPVGTPAVLPAGNGQAGGRAAPGTAPAASQQSTSARSSQQRAGSLAALLSSTFRSSAANHPKPSQTPSSGSATTDLTIGTSAPATQSATTGPTLTNSGGSTPAPPSTTPTGSTSLATGTSVTGTSPTTASPTGTSPTGSTQTSPIGSTVTSSTTPTTGTIPTTSGPSATELSTSSSSPPAFGQMLVPAPSSSSSSAATPTSSAPPSTGG